MINTLKIKGRMMEYGLTQKDVARALEIATPTVSQKINNIRPMNLKEADALASLLKIPTEKIGEFFFSQNIA